MENKPDDTAVLAKKAEQDFGERVRVLRQQADLSQADFARRMTDAGFTMHQTTVAKIEKGTRPTSIGEAVAMGALLGTSAGDILNTLGNKTLQAVRLTVIHTRKQELHAELDELGREASEIMKALRPDWDENDHMNDAFSHSFEIKPEVLAEMERTESGIDQETP